MNLRARDHALGSDGELVGEVAGVTFNPSTNQIYDLVVASSRHSEELIIPILSLTETEDGTARLSIPAERCRDLGGALVERQTVQRGTAAARATIRERLHFEIEAQCADGAAGRLLGVLFDQYTYEITDLIISRSDRFGIEELRAPMHWLQGLDRHHVRLSSEKSELSPLGAALDDR